MPTPTPVCLSEVNSMLPKNFLHAFVHSLYRIDLLNEIGVTKYEIVLPMEHDLVKRYYVDYDEITSPSDQEILRRNRYVKMRQYIENNSRST